ncbi:MAG: hypothetical protein WEB62_00155 [Bacteroidota bacterium]
MGSQSLLTLGGLTLVAVLTLAANRAILGTYSNMLETQAMIASIAEAENLLEEIQAKAFDNALAIAGSDSFAPGQQPGGGKGKPKGLPPGIAKKPADFTPPGLLGRDSNEWYPFFNDIDDFHGLQKRSWNPLFKDSLDIKIRVEYVNPKKTGQAATTQTTAKKVEVKVFTEGMQDTLAVSRVFYQ